MKGPAVDQLVYECMFPKPKTTDPQNFQGLLQRQLVPEVRLETQAFYGHLSSQEAKYPGLDYSYQPHRVRLSRYPWHRRLFRAFDNLGLTRSEIAGLTKWEGTRWAKERFEREQGIIIRDTTSETIADWVEPEHRIPLAPQAHRADVEDMEDIQEMGETEENENEDGMEDDGEDSDNEMTSVGVELNERLVAAAALRNAGNEGTVMDEEWEQWLKDVIDRGGLPFLSTDLSPNANIPGTRPATDSPTMPPRYLNAARLGQWHQIPDFLQNIVRQNLEANNRRMEDTPVTPTSATAPSPAAPSTSTSRIFSRQAMAPHRRAAPPSSSSSSSANSSFGRIDARMVTRLDTHFQEQLSRRPIPPLPSNATPIARSTLRVAPGRSTQPHTGT